MIGRRTLARCAAVLVVSVGLSACAGIKLPRLGGKGGNGSKYQGPGTRIPVLTLDEKLQPAAALRGVDFALPPAEPQTAWPLPGGTPEQSVEHVSAGANFEIAWRRKIGEGRSRTHHVTATPVIAAGRIFAMDGQARISARDERSGAETWAVDLAPRNGRDKEAYGGGVAYADGVLYVSSGFRFVTALDAANGAVKWRTALPSPVHGAPTVAGGRVFVVDVEDQLTVFDAATGLAAWNFQGLEEPARVISASSPAVSGEVVVAPFASGEVNAFRTNNGTALWTDTLSFTNRNNALSEIRDIPGRPVIYRGDVFAGSHSGLFGAIALRDGTRRWDLPIATITTPLPVGDVVYVTDQAGQVICIARESGQVFWTVDLNAGVKKRKDRAIWSGPLLADNRLIVTSTRGEAVALNPKTGARMKTLKLGSGAFLSPIAANGVVYVMSENAELIAIR
ncbi:MAG TPA: PQQ-binding-like beta-propeller repeat protein [Caulobacteraceae bacterium]|jgi:outer membrane protein assembly factor BamB|nr:PQQ-binding-like beta-propeller repeat protein [Caulobacteraceae bacterium]